jgi:hypothetical protein
MVDLDPAKLLAKGLTAIEGDRLQAADPTRHRAAVDVVNRAGCPARLINRNTIGWRGSPAGRCDRSDGMR